MEVRDGFTQCAFRNVGQHGLEVARKPCLLRKTVPGWLLRSFCCLGWTGKHANSCLRRNNTVCYLLSEGKSRLCGQCHFHLFLPVSYGICEVTTWILFCNISTFVKIRWLMRCSTYLISPFSFVTFSVSLMCPFPNGSAETTFLWAGTGPGCLVIVLSFLPWHYLIDIIDNWQLTMK